MSGAKATSRLVESLLLSLLGMVAIIGMTMPLDPGRLAAPDLVYGLLIAWVIRRPGKVPVWMAPALGLLADFVLMRPPGLGGLGLMLATETFRARAGFFQSAPFLLEWLAAAAGFAAVLFGMRLVLGITFAGGPGAMELGLAVLATAAAYPLVVLGLVWCLRIRAPGARP